MVNHHLPPVSSEPAVSAQSLGSGSSGNALLITTGQHNLLIDCGVNIRRLTAALNDRWLSLADIATICVTHEHGDHVASLSRAVHRGMALVATQGTARRCAIPRSAHRRVTAFTPATVRDVTIWPLAISHDAKEPCGFLLELPGGVRVAILTDLGVWTPALAPYLQASDLIMLEANYDEQMLARGPYPMHLKRRIASDKGHLSNRQAAEALAHALRRTRHRPEIWLAHLSEANNRPAIAEQTVRQALAAAGLDLSVTALPRDRVGAIWTPAAGRTPPGELPQVVRVPEQLGLGLGLTSRR